jgi:diguanylate cyclase (GGDEF)-like protein
MMRLPEADGRAALVTWTDVADGQLVTAVDATNRYRALRELRASYALADRTRSRLQLVIDAAIAFSEATSEERLGEILADTTARAYGAEESATLLLGEDRWLRLTAGTNPFDELIQMSLAASFVREMREVVKVSGADEGDALSPALGRAMRATGVEALLVAPLEHEARSYGVFACFFRHPRVFDQEATPLAEALAGQAAQALVSVRLQSRLEHAAMHDDTTGLPNRRLLEERMREQIVGERHGRAVIFLDLDGFKDVNDALGHAVGDDVLREVGRRLQAAVREGDIVARYGGDEFVVVCGVADSADATEIAERLRAGVQEPFDFLPEGLLLGASVGVALAPVGDERVTLDGVIRAADQAMYLAKSHGGNRVVDGGLARAAS